uniref:Nuclear receptor coactivator 7 n=1 Tax=Timema shepardi TaxID=629360 RepID=A0A7R9AWS7_TIMSH|nr:unnamed protein product [Timema shepardi]
MCNDFVWSLKHYSLHWPHGLRRYSRNRLLCRVMVRSGFDPGRLYLELIPRPARSCEDPPLYLRLRMGKPINKKIPKSTPIMSYGKKKMRPEYWFSVPRNRVDELYSFLQLWVPHLYGDLDDMDPKSRGFELVESDTELWEDEGGDLSRRGTLERSSSSEDGDLGELTRESWEVIKAPYAKLYTILKTQTQSSESEPMEEVGPLPSTFKMAQISRSSKAFTSRKVSSRTSPLDESKKLRFQLVLINEVLL